MLNFLAAASELLMVSGLLVGLVFTSTFPSMVQKLSILLFFFNFKSVLTVEWLALVKSSVMKVLSGWFFRFDLLP